MGLDSRSQALVNERGSRLSVGSVGRAPALRVACFVYCRQFVRCFNPAGRDVLSKLWALSIQIIIIIIIVIKYHSKRASKFVFP